MADFDPKKTYAEGINAVKTAEDEASARKRALTSLYTAAVEKLGYNDRQLAHNKDAQKAVAKLMFSDELAGNPAVNILLGKSPFYAGFAKATDDNLKQLSHQSALGMNYAGLVSTMERFGGSLDSSTMNSILQRVVMESYTDQAIDNFLSAKAGSSYLEQQAAYAGLAGMDANIGAVNAGMMDIADIKELAGDSMKGRTNRESLEHTVGVELPKYEWKQAA
jgi:hypothetical protein